MPLSPSERGSLGPTGQHELLDELAEVVRASAPADFDVAAVEYLCLGRYVKLRAGMTDSTGQPLEWEPPTEVDHLFWRLRAGMFVRDLGCWYSAFFRIKPSGPYEVFYNRDNEPPWDPAESDFLKEQELFPRSDIHQPDWFRRRLAANRAGSVVVYRDERDRQGIRLSPADVDDLVGSACAMLAENAPADWSTMVLIYRASSTVCQAEIVATARDGRRLLMALPEQMHQVLRRLRGSMADETNGAWLSARFTLIAGMEPAVEFDYMRDPIWAPPVDPSVFVRDLQDFPRHPARVPEWLRVIAGL